MVMADERGIFLQSGEGGIKIARLCSAKGADLANAHLFSVSALLLEALKEADEYDELGLACPASVKQKRLTAIAKAEGRL
jgi:hypothetical protein